VSILHPGVNVFERAFGWWFLAERVCSHLTAPRTDLAKSDQAFERLLVGSRLWSIGDRMTRRVEAAWLDSTLRCVTRAIVNGSAQRRVIGWTMMVAAMTVVVAQALGAGRTEPLASIAPLFIAITGLVLWFNPFVARLSKKPGR
jgi:hypothetical protein